MKPSEIPGIQQVLDQTVESAGGWYLEVDDTWLQGRSWYGGLQLALAMRAARSQVDEDIPVRSLHAAFLGPVGDGVPVLARAEVLRAGRSVTHVRAWLEQGGERRFEVLALFGRGRESALDFDSNRPRAWNPDEAVQLAFHEGLTPAFTRHYDLRWAAGAQPFSSATDPRATMLVRPAGDHPYTESEFLGLTDVIPPPVITLLKRPAPVSSMNTAVELIRPEVVYGTRQWIRFDIELHDTHSGYAWHTARIYDEAGQLLAISHQSVAVFG